MITEEKLKEGCDDIRIELKEQVTRLCGLIIHEQWADAYELHLEMGIGLMGIVIVEDFLNE